ncbi:MAG: RsmD family RNA methyltransferase, partial [Phycisphaerae bacterium]|nr:RsmD family RNA methyltransferase [Phycisphaerae bacterium]
MRVIAGIWRRRQLIAPDGEGTRPMLDRAKVVVFDWLGAHLAEPGYIPDVPVLDLFAGAGTLGIEC